MHRPPERAPGWSRSFSDRPGCSGNRPQANNRQACYAHQNCRSEAVYEREISPSPYGGVPHFAPFRKPFSAQREPWRHACHSQPKAASSAQRREAPSRLQHRLEPRGSSPVGPKRSRSSLLRSSPPTRTSARVSFPQSLTSVLSAFLSPLPPDCLHQPRRSDPHCSSVVCRYRRRHRRRGSELGDLDQIFPERVAANRLLRYDDRVARLELRS